MICLFCFLYWLLVFDFASIILSVSQETFRVADLTFRIQWDRKSYHNAQAYCKTANSIGLPIIKDLNTATGIKGWMDQRNICKKSIDKLNIQ